MAQEKQQQLVREDPVPVFRATHEAVIIGKKDDRAYMLANPNDVMFGAPSADLYGWKPIDANSDKERVQGWRPGRDNSAHVTWFDQILMWMPRDKYEQIQKAKEQHAVETQARIDGPGGIDGVTNLDGVLAKQTRQLD